MSLMRYFAVKGVSDLPGPVVISLSIGLIEWFVGYNYGWLPVVISLAVMFAIVKAFTNILKSADTMADYDHKKLQEFLRRPESHDATSELPERNEAKLKQEEVEAKEKLRGSLMRTVKGSELLAKMDQDEADRKEADERRQEELLGSLIPVDPFPNPIGRKLEKMEEVVKLYVSTLDRH